MPLPERFKKLASFFSPETLSPVEQKKVLQQLMLELETLHETSFDQLRLKVHAISTIEAMLTALSIGHVYSSNEFNEYIKEIELDMDVLRKYGRKA